MKTNIDTIEQVMKHALGDGVKVEILRQVEGHYSLIISLNDKALLDAKDSAGAFKTFLQETMTIATRLAAADFWAEHRAEVLAKINPEAVANLALADAAREIREALLTPKKP